MHLDQKTEILTTEKLWVPNGYLLVDKPVGITSYDVIRKVKRLLPRKYKIGHAGTLDPFASGLLILMLGTATKSWSQLQECAKRYVVKAKFGFATDTLDIDGKVIAEIDSETPITQTKVESALTALRGEIMQTPPHYSAVKIDGKRAYDLARDGVEFEIKPRKTYIYSNEIVRLDWPELVLDLKVSSGTYIRTIVDDLARSLGSLATATELRRTSIGDYNVETAAKFQDIDDMLAKVTADTPVFEDSRTTQNSRFSDEMDYNFRQVKDWWIENIITIPK